MNTRNPSRCASLIVLPAVAGEFAYVVACEFDADVIAEALIPTLYGACGNGFDAFDAEYIGATFGQAVDQVHGVLGDGQAVLGAVFGVLCR
ncbi:hypothetical protein [Marinomonas primoryensis]|uniref:hypothetical protein n=1 Tax=Marinomonas primoryensis TaxID=178399 RepID=UPI001594BBE1|nr:hypothetical protein [Marinomonas primoryensis]